MATFTADGILGSLEDTFNKSSRNDVACYLLETGMPRRWFIVSDYCLRDSNKSNDVIAFTAIPGGKEFPSFDKLIHSSLPKDWKNIKTIDDQMAAALRNERHFHFCFIIDRKRKLFSTDGTDAERAVIREAVEELLIVARKWPNQSKHKRDLAAFGSLRQKVQRNSFSVDLFTDFYLASIFAGFVSYIFARYANAEIVSWFSDRDSILTWADGAAHAYYSLVVASLCRQKKIQEPEIVIGVPKGGEHGSKPFYDAFVRLPDFYAGGLASWDIKNNMVATNNLKYKDIVEKVISDNRRLAILSLHLENESLQFTRLKASLSSPL